MSELKQSTRRALAWSAVDKAGQQVFLLLVSLTAMRWWLGPEDFGLVAPLALFTAVATLLIEGGFSLALLRRADASERDYNTMFWFNAGLGVLFYGVLFTLAPAIARYNHAPELTAVARWHFLSILFSSLGMIHSTLLLKRNDFRRVTLAGVVPAFLSSATVIALAAMGWGYWALVGQVLVLALSKTGILWILTGWRPRPVFYGESVRKVFGFSARLILGSLANAFSVNFYNAALGDFIPRGQLGFYDRANRIKETAPGFLAYIFGPSILVMLSRLIEEPERFRAAFRKAIRALSFLLFPATFGLFVVIEPLVEVLLTETWLPTVPYIRILCFSSLLAVLSVQHANALKIRGRSDITLILDISNAVLVVVFLLATIRYGLRAALVADLVLKGLVYAAYTAVSARVLGYRPIDQLRDWAPYAGLAAGMAAVVWPLGLWIENPLLLAAAQATLGAALYLGGTYLLGSKVFEEVRQTILKKSENKI